MKSKFGFWECDYCATRFLKEPQYTKHRCEMKERAEFIDTKRGRFSYMVYCEFMKAKGFIKQTKAVFRESKYYNSILKFADFYYSMMLPDMPDYVDFVVNEIDLLPQFWVRADVYEQYILAYDDRVNPYKQADVTFALLSNLAATLECDPGQVFDYIYGNELAKLIQSKRFSPWVLLNSTRYALYLKECTDDERTILDSMINPEMWEERFAARPKARRSIASLTKEFGI